MNQATQDLLAKLLNRRKAELNLELGERMQSVHFAELEVKDQRAKYEAVRLEYEHALAALSFVLNTVPDQSA